MSYNFSRIPNPDQTYIGFTEDLNTRLTAHNQSKDPLTAKYKPWKIKTASAFTDRDTALDFEGYLESPSGRAYADFSKIAVNASTSRRVSFMVL